MKQIKTKKLLSIFMVFVLSVGCGNRNKKSAKTVTQVISKQEDLQTSKKLHCTAKAFGVGFNEELQRHVDQTFCISSESLTESDCLTAGVTEEAISEGALKNGECPQSNLSNDNNEYEVILICELEGLQYSFYSAHNFKYNFGDFSDNPESFCETAGGMVIEF